MGKFLVAVVHPSDAEAVTTALTDGGYRATRIETTGGFLGDPSITFFLAIDDADETRVLDLFEATCSTREVELPLVLHERLRDHPHLVPHAGANVFVLELGRHVRF